MRNRVVQILFTTAVSVCTIVVMIMGSPPVHAGDGNYNDGTPDTLDLNVLFTSDVSPEFNPNTAWEGAFSRASELLYNATDGQVQLGTIAFYNACPSMFNRADIRIQKGEGRANAHPNGLTTVSTRGAKPGWRVLLYNDTNSANTPDNRGHVTIVHELGHYVFGLYDGYRDSAGNEFVDPNGTPIACVPGDPNASLTDAGGRHNNFRTEFALYSTELTACSNTEQVEKRKTIDWPWIKHNVQKEYGASLVMPTVRNTTMPAGHQNVTFQYYDCSVRSVLTLDRSGSMSGNKLATAKAGAKNFIDLASIDSSGNVTITDEIGIVSYSSAAASNFAIQPMTDPNKVAAKATVDQLRASGSTNIGDGLQTALGMITGRGTPVSNEVIILLSDGRHNTGTNPSSVLPALKQRNVTVHTIGLGGDVDASLLSNIANGTGGSYVFVSNAQQLEAHFNRLYHNARQNGEIARLTRVAAANQATAAALSITEVVEIDTYTERGGEATFFLSWDSGDLNFSLTRPDQTVVAETDPDVLQFIKEAGSAIYRIRNPTAGQWAVTITSTTAIGDYDFQAHSSAYSGVFVSSSAPNGTYYSGEQILVQTIVSAPPAGAEWDASESVSGASVVATIRLNDNVQTTMTLFDDGKQEHGDDEANDGIYSNYYKPEAVGNYTFDVVVNNQSGVILPGEALETFTSDDERNVFLQSCVNCTSRPVAPFTRYDSFSVVVVPSEPPDLVVESVTATESRIDVVIKNVGLGPVLPEHDFWVDVYVNPDTVPTSVNDVWEFAGSQGTVWGVTAFPYSLNQTVLQPGETLALFIDSLHYWPSLSNISGLIPPETPIYVHVDSANAESSYGGVLESHELSGGIYNNIFGPILSTSVGGSNQHNQRLYLPLIFDSSLSLSSAHEDAALTEPANTSEQLPARPLQ